MIEHRIPLRATYDADADAVYLYLDDIPPGGVAETVPVDPVAVGGMVNLDLDDGGRLLGLEVLDARSKPPEALLRALVGPEQK